ncbi:unnamed protein product [Macrosiphum euphorbiae]|uniref:Mutator-like transposase domain-containing protein n=1 Tax=Macrosiphum euphorbiae TaxID=13131 RepID=A0AAV0XVH5_9HEMI|nr:unnamed protein product [Macrosiphum euphorbiae]
MDVNTAAVTASVNSGQGYVQLEILSALLNMPSMSNKLYQKIHEKVEQFTHNTAWESMSSAAEEEAKLAIDNGDVNENGVPMITVIADGAWSKRSYRTNYNALSGVGCIVGAKLKKSFFWALETNIVQYA